MQEILTALVQDPDRTNAIAAVANVLIAVIALIIAAVSIFVSVSSLGSQKTHNKLSVRPLPFIAIADYEDRLWVKLVNNGAGPLIVLSTEVCGNNQSSKGVIERMPKMPPQLAWKSFTSGMQNRSVPPSSELFFIDLTGNPNDPVFQGFRDKCRQALAELHVSVQYTDIYGDSFDSVTRDLKWFERHLMAKNGPVV